LVASDPASETNAYQIAIEGLKREGEGDETVKHASDLTPMLKRVPLGNAFKRGRSDDPNESEPRYIKKHL
jgi:hypothetical protein